MDKHEKFIDSLVFEYLKRMEKNSSVLFSVNRSPVSNVGKTIIVFAHILNYGNTY